MGSNYIKVIKLSFFSNIFKKKPQPIKKESQTTRLLVHNSVGGPVYTERDYNEFSTEIYLKNIIGMRCIDEIAKNVSLPPAKLCKQLDEEDFEFVSNHEINNLIHRPNPGQSWNFLIYRLTAFLALTGNTYLEGVRPNRPKAYPKELYSHIPNRINAELDARGRIARYAYRISGGEPYYFEIDPITGKGDLLHIQLFHPVDDIYGASPGETASRQIDSSNEATDWNMNLIRNQGRPGMVFTLVGDMSDEEFDRFERHLDEKFSGPDHVGRNLILTGESGTKAEPYSFTPQEMEFIEGNRELSRNIALAWGVPPQLLGIPGDSTYNNQKEARLAFWETTITFYLRLVYGEINNWLFSDKDRLFIKYIEDNISALEPRYEILWQRAKDADWLTFNEKRKLTGYEAIGPEGDIVLVDQNKIPLGVSVVQTQNPNETDTTDIEDEPDDTDNMDDETKGIALEPWEKEMILGLREAVKE